jgi:hypothetical protein
VAQLVREGLDLASGVTFLVGENRARAGSRESLPAHSY